MLIQSENIFKNLRQPLAKVVTPPVYYIMTEQIVLIIKVRRTKICLKKKSLLIVLLVETEGLSYEEWLRWRKKGIGGSDVSAILGINHWNSAIDLWLEKTNQRNKPVEVNEAMTWGTILEPVIRGQFASITGKPVTEVKAILQHPDYPFMLADVDGITTDNHGNSAILEIKTASEYKRDEWSEV